MTAADPFDTAVEALHEQIAARKVAAIFTEHVGPRTAWLLHRPLDRPAPHCGHDTGRHIVDWVCANDMRVLCEMCEVDHYATLKSPHTDPRILRCIMCGSTDSLGPIIVPVQLLWPVPAEGGVMLRGVEMVEGVPVGWLCPAHDGAVEDPIVRVKQWRSGNGGS